MSDTGVQVVKTATGIQDALAVREAVFIEGQSVPAAHEHDGKDDEATHFVAYDGEHPIGVARLRELNADTGKVERVAVRESRRGEGWGRRLIAAVEDEARDQQLSTLVCHAQTPVEVFYRKLGYRTVSDEFEEAGMAHIEMEKELQ